MKAKNNNSNSSLIAISIMIALLLLVSWGMNNVKVALFLIEHPVMILPYVSEKLVDKFGYFKLISASFIMTFIVIFLLLNRHSAEIRERVNNY